METSRVSFAELCEEGSLHIRESSNDSPQPIVRRGEQ